jgi:hypothetical protein
MSTAGKEKFEKYFSTGLTKTKTKEDTEFIGWRETIPKGSFLVVTQNTYSPKVEIQYDGRIGHVRFSALHKPIHNTSTIPFRLKPDVLGVTGYFSVDSYATRLRYAILGHPDVPAELKDYLLCLVDHAQGGNINPAPFDRVKHDRSVLATVNVDFSELLAPFAFGNVYQGDIYFPEKGNEPLYDFKIGDTLISCKAAVGNVNTLKPGSLYDRVIGDLIARKMYTRELEILRILKSTPIKIAPDVINEWLIANNIGKCAEPKQNRSIEEIVILERAVAKAINNSELNFVELIRRALTGVVYIRSGINSHGEYIVSDIIKAEFITQAKLRSKNSKGHMTDRLGFDVC